MSDGEDGRGQEKLAEEKKKKVATASVAGTKYDLVIQTIEECGMRCLHSEDATKSAFLVWSDSSVQTESLQELKNYQRINHFPGMAAICRKDCLARNMAKIARERPDEYDFVPETWILPSEYNVLLQHYKDRKRKGKGSTYIGKPQNGAMGNGIHLFQNPSRLPPSEPMIVQEYLDQPYILDGYKIDLRLYVLVTHCYPLKAFLYQDGLVRLGTEKYTSPTDDNMKSSFMHLTNYSVNKHSKNFERHDGHDRGSKRSVLSFMKYLKSSGCNTGLLWRQITNVIVKTLIVASPILLHNYKICRPGQHQNSESVCFEILGFDILLDRKLKPWLLEVNRSPSFSTDESIDHEVKSGVLKDSIRLINIRPGDKFRHMAKQKADAQRRLFKNRGESRTPDSTNREHILNKRRSQLKEKLSWAKVHATREEFENLHMNNFRRIYPSYETHLQNRYLDLLKESFQIFYPNASKSIQRHLLDLHKYEPESEIVGLMDELDMEIDDATDLEHDNARSSTPQRTKLSSTKRIARGPSAQPHSKMQAVGYKHRVKQISRKSCRVPVRPATTSATFTGIMPQEKSWREQSAINDNDHLRESKRVDVRQINQQDVDVSAETLKLLSSMKLKFPGKSDAATSNILNYMADNWSMHKAQLAYYWLVKLDSVKREKVIDIVRHNVQRAVQTKWIASDQKYYKIKSLIDRIFNLMLSCHGQGLWTCFSTPNNLWEKSLNRSQRNMTETETEISRRIVNLCKDCLLIVFQFSHDVEGLPIPSPEIYSIGDHGIMMNESSPRHVKTALHTSRGVHVPTRSLKYPEKSLGGVQQSVRWQTRSRMIKS